MRHFPSLFIDTHKTHIFVTSADGRTTKTGLLFCHFLLFSKLMNILNYRVFPDLHIEYVLNLAREGVYIVKHLMGFINSFRPCVSNLFMANGHSG